MKTSVLVVHNRYQQAGGEDQVFASESALLEERGHRVIRYEVDNSTVAKWGAGEAVGTIWSSRSAKRIGELVREHKADVVHLHNTFPLISPAAYYAARREGAAVVQTLHNFRLLCPGATLYRDGGVCEDCVQQRSFRPAMANKCYRGSRPATATVAAMLTVHRAAGTWRRKVDAYIALSEFARDKFIDGGLPEAKIAVKPNFVAPDPGVGEGRGGFALFVGRLSAEKGIATMVEAWKELGDIPLIVAGDGPMAEAVGERGVGRQTREKVFKLMREATLLVFPSEGYEGPPMVIAEALACGTPVVASDLGSMAGGRWGFRAGDPRDLARVVRMVWGQAGALRAEARREFEEKYTADRNYEMLMAIYERALARRRA